MNEPRWPVVTGIVVGLALGAVGVTSLLQTADDSNPVVAVRWLAGVLVVHDLLLAPFVLLVGATLRRWIPVGLRRWVVAGLLVAGPVTLVAFPLVRGYGRRASDPSALPREYGTGLAVTVLVAWGAITALALLSRRRHPARGDTAPMAPSRRPPPGGRA